MIKIKSPSAPAKPVLSRRLPMAGNSCRPVLWAGENLTIILKIYVILRKS